MFRIYGIAPTKDGLVEYGVWSSSLLPEDLREQQELLQDTIRRLGQSSREFRIRRPDNQELRHVESVETVRMDAQGQTEWVVGTNLDITERKRTQDELIAKTALLEAQVDSTLDGILVVNEQQKVILTNPGEPKLEWLCGPIAPLGNGRFQIYLERAGSTAYLATRKNGTDTVRGIVQPLHININSFRNQEGKPQAITFDKIPDVTAGTKSVPLSAKSDSGLPVSYYVAVGPAMVMDGKIVFTGLPPRTKFPVTVTVAAWQWGRGAEPKVKTASVIEQTFKILAQ
jgi:hypothetical protein